ncbi:hypothetical protein PG984_014138 [Apiospora sp. TS-2023a]
MQLSLVKAFVALLGVAHALPADLEVRDQPSNAPVTVHDAHFHKGHHLDFPDWCPEDKDYRLSFPLKNNGPFDGGDKSQSYGKERVVYWYEGEVDEQGHSLARYCGIMTHKGGAEKGAFLMC